MEKNYVNLNEDIENLNLSCRTFNALKRAGFSTVGDLVTFSREYRLEDIKNLGPVSIEELKGSLLENCNVFVQEKDTSELEKFNLSTRAIHILMNKFDVWTLEELLRLSIDQKYSDYSLNSNNKSEKEIINKVHNLGYSFYNEQNHQVLLTDPIRKLGISRLLCLNLFRFGIKTVEDLLNLSLNKNDSINIYQIKGITEKKIDQLIALVRSYGLKFSSDLECLLASVEKEESMLKRSTDSTYVSPYDDISKLNYYPILTSKMRDYGIYTIHDLLELSLDSSLKAGERGLYKINGFSGDRIRELVDLVHSYGLKFYDEISSKKAEFEEEYYRLNNKDIYNFSYTDDFKEHDRFTDSFPKFMYNILYVQDYVGLKSYFKYRNCYTKEDLDNHFLACLEKDFGISNIDFKDFVHEEFQKFIGNLHITINDYIQVLINREFKKYDCMAFKKTNLKDMVFDRFINILNQEYIRKYIYSILMREKDNLRNNWNYTKLLKVYDRVLLFIHLEKKELLENCNFINYDELVNVEQKMINERNNLDFLIEQHFLDKEIVDKKIDHDVMDIVHHTILSLKEDYQLEETSFDIDISLDKLFSLLPCDLLNEEFYDKINLFYHDIMDNQFVIDFIRFVGKVCCEEDRPKYTTKEILLFLENKLMENSMNLSFEIDSNCEDVYEDIDTKKRVRKSVNR